MGETAYEKTLKYKNYVLIGINKEVTHEPDESDFEAWQNHLLGLRAARTGSLLIFAPFPQFWPRRPAM
jgi:hypothetical protein